MFSSIICLPLWGHFFFSHVKVTLLVLYLHKQTCKAFSFIFLKCLSKSHCCLLSQRTHMTAISYLHSSLHNKSTDFNIDNAPCWAWYGSCKNTPTTPCFSISWSKLQVLWKAELQLCLCHYSSWFKINQPLPSNSEGNWRQNWFKVLLNRGLH